MSPDVEGAVAQAHRQVWGQALAVAARVLGDLDEAEECAQDAFVAALETWPARGVPRNPDGWIVTATRNRAVDRLRRAVALRRRLPLLLQDPAETPEGPGESGEPGEPGDGDAGAVPDDLLRLVFTCCHPALAADARVALTLRLVCGVPTAAIASVLLVAEPTVAARITRAKKKIASAGIPYRVPSATDLPERLEAALTVVHLVSTVGHTRPGGAGLDDPALAERALHLARAMAALLPDEPEVQGLLALLLLTHARRHARTDPDGRLVLLEDQDRGLWDAAEVAEGIAVARRALTPPYGRFALQAAIAACHAAAPSAARTDWRRVVRLYDLLLQAWPTPVVALNRAAAVAFADGPAAGLDELAPLDGDPALRSYHYLPAARADLLRRLGRGEEAARAYRAALVLCDNEIERDFLLRRLAAIDP
jgi:RNA polymerase sigma-70 factor (ECF subfamily)